jgi:hypothetical protein
MIPSGYHPGFILTRLFSKFSKSQFWYVTALLPKKINEVGKEPSTPSQKPQVLKGFRSNWNRRFFDSGIANNKQKLSVL